MTPQRRTRSRILPRVGALLITACVTGCRGSAKPTAGTADTPVNALNVSVAASLDGAVRSSLGRFAQAHGTLTRQQTGASIALARRITDLHEVPDLLVLADAELFSTLLVPQYASWYLGFATDHMVLCYGFSSRFATEVNASNWMDIVRRPGVQVGRADPATAPVGYRTLLLFQLAEQHAGRPGLADSLLAAAPARNVRGDASALAALLATGELDYVFDYRSVADAHGFRYVTLPPEIDLGDPARAAAYALASARFASGRGPADTTLVRGAPILSALTIPIEAAHPQTAQAFLAELLGPAGRATFADAHLEMLRRFVFVGADTPAFIKPLLEKRPQ